MRPTPSAAHRSSWRGEDGRAEWAAQPSAPPPFYPSQSVRLQNRLNGRLNLRGQNSVNIGHGVAQFGEIKYPIANISSYRTSKVTIPKAGSAALVIGLFSAAIGLFYFIRSIEATDNIPWAMGWICVGFFFVYGCFSRKEINTYNLYITSAGGEKQAFQTSD